MDDDRLIKQWAEDFKRAGHQIPEISRSVRKSAVYQYVELVINMASYLFVFGYIAYFVTHPPREPWSPWSIFLDIVVTLVFVIALFLYFKFRRGTWRTAEETPRGLLRFLRRQEEARLREARASELLVFIAFVAIFIFAIRKVCIAWREQPDLPMKELALLFITIAIWIGYFFLFRYWTRRKRRNLEKVALLEKSFDNGLEIE